MFSHVIVHVRGLVLHCLLTCLLQHVLRVSDTLTHRPNVVSALSDGLTMQKPPEQWPSCDSPPRELTTTGHPQGKPIADCTCIAQALIDQARLQCQVLLDVLRVCTQSLVPIDDLVWNILDFVVINLKWNACDLKFRQHTEKVVVPSRCTVCGS